MKVKKILECICVNCGKLKADIVRVTTHFPTTLLFVAFFRLFPALTFHVCSQSDPGFAEKIRHVRDPKKRMAAVWNHCKSKMICETDEPKDEGEGDREEDGTYKETKKGHGGCGHIQPVIRKDALKLYVQYKKPKDDDDVCHCVHRTLRPR